MNVSLQNKNGLTLIEVLIALAILSIALTAIIKSTTQNIKNTLYLQNRTIATWIASDVINNVRSSMLRIPDEPDHLTQENKVLGQNWTFTAALSATPNKQIKKIDVSVFQKTGRGSLAHLVSYFYAQK